MYLLYRVGQCAYRRAWLWLAEQTWRRAIRFAPLVPALHHALAALSHAEGNALAAVSYTTTGLTLTLRDASMLHTRGTAFYYLEETGAALASFKGASDLQPGSRTRASAAAFPLLRAGEYPAGLAAYEARPMPAAVLRRLSGVPRWTGEDLRGMTGLVWTAQGYGDAIQFIRYAPQLAQRTARVLVLCPPALARLFRILPRVEILHTYNSLRGIGRIDRHIPVGSLPFHVGTTVDTIPAEPYLRTRADARVSLPVGNGVRVGLVWSGQTNKPHERMRAIPLDSLLPVLISPAGPGRPVSWYSLQVGPAAGDLRQFGLAGLIHDVSPRLGDFADTAAAINHLDLVVTGGYLCGTSRRSDGKAGLDLVALYGGLAVVRRQDRQPVVSDGTTLPSAVARQLG